MINKTKNGVYVCIDPTKEKYKFVPAKDIVIEYDSSGKPITLETYIKDIKTLKKQIKTVAELIKERVNSD